MHEEEIGRDVVDTAIKVHTALGPGLLETAYESCVEYELILRGYPVRRQIPMPVRYKDTMLDIGYRLDLLVAEKLVIEIKAVDKIMPIHGAQLLTYLRLGQHKLGFLLNFNTVHMRDGIKRVVNGLYSPLPA